MSTTNPIVEEYKKEMETLLRNRQDKKAGEIGVKIHGLLAENELAEFHAWLSLRWKQLKKERGEIRAAQLAEKLDILTGANRPTEAPKPGTTQKPSFFNRLFGRVALSKVHKNNAAAPESKGGRSWAYRLF